MWPLLNGVGTRQLIQGVPGRFKGVRESIWSQLILFYSYISIIKSVDLPEIGPISWFLKEYQDYKQALFMCVKPGENLLTSIRNEIIIHNVTTIILSNVSLVTATKTKELVLWQG